MQRFIIFLILIFSTVAFPTAGFSKEKVIEKAPPLALHPDSEMDQKNESILKKMMTESGWFSESIVRVENGIVVLEGQANNKDQIDWLVKSAERLPAVITVINRTQIHQTPLTDLSPIREQLKIWIVKLKQEVPRLFMTLLVSLAFFFLAKFLHRLSTRLWSYRIDNPFLLAVVARFFLFPVYIFMFYIILQTIGLQSLATTIIGGTGVIGLILGLALKGITENFFSGILLAMRSPFTKGDQIKVGDIKGVVQNLNMRGTTILDQDGILTLIPNTTVVQSIIQNISANPATRTSFTISIAFENSISEAQKILLGVLEKTERVLREPAPLVLVDQIEKGGVTLKIYFWFELKNSSLIGSRSRVIAACKEALVAAGIAMEDRVMRVALTDEEGHLPTAISRIDSEDTHDQMLQGGSPDEALKKMARKVSLPGNSQSPNLLKKEKDS